MPGDRRHVVYMPLDDVIPAYRNPHQHDKEMIAGSISRFGIVSLPVVDERTGRLVAGHGRLNDWRERRDAGEQPPDGLDIDDDGRWLVPVVRGWASRSDADAEAYLVADNQSTMAGKWDDPSLAQLLADIRDQDPELLALAGFDDKFIATHWEGDSNPWDYADGKPADEGDAPAPEHECPTCGHKHRGQPLDPEVP
jgi:hypothetical protein